MARSPKKARSSSRGRSTATKKTPAKTPVKTPVKTPAKTRAKAAAPKMDFEEGNNVMSRWPGTSLYFKSKVTFVREDDNEYDVQFEDGTVYTLKAKDVKKFNAKEVSASPRKKTPSRSRSRGRSPGRPKTSPGRTPAKAKEVASPSPARRSSRSSAVVRAPKPEPTPVRSSARLAASKMELSDEEDGRKAIPNPAHPKRGARGGFFDGLNFQWLVTLVLMGLCPLLLVSLHTISKSSNYQRAEFKLPALDKNLRTYWNENSFAAVVVFFMAIRILSFIPLGSVVRSATGQQIRLNGFYTLLSILAVVPALVMRKSDFSFVRKNYFTLMSSTLIFSFILSVVAFIISRWGRRSNANPKGNTGNIIVDFFYGRELNPYFAGGDLKLIAFRMSMIGLAVLNVTLVIDNFTTKSGNVNPAVVLTAAFQVLYALDAMYFEQYFFFSYDGMNTGFGNSLITSYLGFPFIPTLVTRYMIANDPKLTTVALVGIFIMNALGYIIFRTSETQRCEFAKSPSNPSLKHLQTMSTTAGRKLLCGGYWGLVRHPNILGDIMIQWSWIAPAVFLAVRGDLLLFYLPVTTTFMLIARVFELNKRNKRKYGTTWDNYCQNVKANIVPYVF